MIRPTLLLAVCLALAGVVGACGGSGRSVSSEQTSSIPATSPSASPSEGSPSSSAENPSVQKPSHPQAAGSRPQGAAGFVTSRGDNSIPRYGSEASTVERAAATKGLRTYLAAREARRWAKACDYLGGQARGLLSSLAQSSGGKVKGCGGAYAVFAAHTTPAELTSPLGAGVAAFRVKGDRGFALFYGSRGQKYMMPMVKEGGEWRVTLLAPTLYPLGAAPGGG